MVISVGKWVFMLKEINNYECLGGFNSYPFIYVHSSPYLFVCGDDQVTCYPGADDVTVEPKDV